MIHYPIRQVAYFVRDIRAAARGHHGVFGSGPYFIADNIPLSRCEHRGAPASLDHSSAYGQWGEVMIEFCQQNNDDPSVFRDLYQRDEQGLHHVALMVDDLGSAMRTFEHEGHPTALYAEVASGPAYAMMDCVGAYGHFVELYEGSSAIRALYDRVRSASDQFDGDDLLRSLR